MKFSKSVCRLISLFLAVVVAGSAGIVSFAVTDENSFEILPEREVIITDVRTRKEVDGLRMYVDRENPLFMFRPVSNGQSVAQSSLDTYNAIPEDVRNFAVMYIDHEISDFTKEQQMAFWEEYLSFSDKYNVPTVVQVENFCTNGTRDGFSAEELSDILKRHSSLIGFVQVELSTSGVSKTNKATERIYERTKACIRACKENGALFIWQDMEYIWWEKNCYINHMLEDTELYDLMKSCSQNIIIMDKHNGNGRHFSSQSNILGCWLDDVCSNWGVNLENWIWYEEGYQDYNDTSRANEDDVDYRYTAKYPPALYGIDIIADMVGGATVYAFEGAYSHGGLCASDKNGDVVFTKGFYEVIYPLYQHILKCNVPSKDDVKENIKVAYQFTYPRVYSITGSDAHLLQGLYCVNPSLLQEKLFKPYIDGTKDWVPSTGRYYIIPIMPKYSDVEAVLPDTYVLNDFLFCIMGMFITPLKLLFFNNKYGQAYTGDGVLYDINNFIYIFNSNENKTVDAVQSVDYMMKSGKKLSAELDAHTYAIISENDNEISVDLTNLKLDTDDIPNVSESEWLRDYIENGKVGDIKNYRTTKLSLSGFVAKPEITATGSNSAKMKTEFNETDGVLSLTVISNGEVKINIKQGDV